MPVTISVTNINWSAVPANKLLAAVLTARAALAATAAVPLTPLVDVNAVDADSVAAYFEDIDLYIRQAVAHDPDRGTLIEVKQWRGTVFAFNHLYAKVNPEPMVFPYTKVNWAAVPKEEKQAAIVFLAEAVLSISKGDGQVSPTLLLLVNDLPKLKLWMEAMFNQLSVWALDNPTLSSNDTQSMTAFYLQLHKKYPAPSVPPAIDDSDYRKFLDLLPDDEP